MAPITRQHPNGMPEGVYTVYTFRSRNGRIVRDAGMSANRSARQAIAELDRTPAGEIRQAVCESSPGGAITLDATLDQAWTEYRKS